jgi:hypothetical protein
MANGDAKRAAIIARQAEREKQAIAEGKVNPLPKTRSNWASSPARRPARGRPKAS